MFEVGLRAVVVLLIVAVHKRIYTGDVTHYWDSLHLADAAHLPYRDLPWEFPPLTLLATLPAAVLPRQVFQAGFVAGMLACEYAALRVLRGGLEPPVARRLTAYWTVVVVLGLPVVWFRLDPLSVLVAVPGVLVLATGHSRGRRSGAAAVAAVVLGWLTKLWPVTLVAGFAVQRRWRVVVASVGATLLVTVAWVGFSPAGFRDFLRFREGSGVQIESVPGAALLAVGRPVTMVSGAFVADEGGWQAVSAALTVGGLVLAASLVLAAVVRRTTDPVALVGALIAVLMLSSRLLSPQYLLWLLPIAAWQWSRERRFAAGLYATSCLLTAPVVAGYGLLLDREPPLVALLLARNVLLLACCAVFARDALTRPGPADAQAPAAGAGLGRRAATTASAATA